MKHQSHITDYAAREQARQAYITWLLPYLGNGLPDQKGHSTAPKKGTSKLAKLANLD
jgi:hypothetical protein